jgi:hypothetical protein
MATWKKVITEDDSIGIAQGGTGLTAITAGNIIVGNGTTAPALVHLDESQILVGAGTGTTAPIKATLEGDVTIAHSGGTVTSTIGADKVLGTMVLDNDLDWATHQKVETGAGSATKLPIFDASGNPTLTTAGTNGNILTVNSSNEIIWGSSLTASGVGLSVSNGAAALPVALVTGTGTSTTALMEDTTFTWNDSTDTLTLGEVTIVGAVGAGTSSVTADNFSGLASEATQIAVTNYGTTTTTSTSHCIPMFAGTGNGSQESLISDNVLSYNPGTNVLSVPAIDSSGNIQASVLISDIATGTAPLTVTSTTQVANLHVAKSGIATTVDVTSEASSASDHYLTFVSSAAAGSTLYADATDLIFIPEDATSGIVGGTLKVPNLTVTGTTTTLSTTNLEVTDKTIKLADANDTAANAIGSGIIVDIANASASNLPSILYAGQDNSASGWQVSRANHATAGSAAITTGLGTMEVVSDITDSNYSTGNSGAIDFGVGAFCYSSNGDGGLYIQTGA